MALEGNTVTLATLTALKAITVALGFLIVFLAWKAYRSTRRRAILVLGVGMAIMTLGAISEALAFQGLSWSLDQSHVFEGVVTLVGFAVLVYSLYVR